MACQVFAWVALVVLVVAPRLGATRDLTGAPALAHAYDLILSAEFDRAEEALGPACPPAPAEACALLGVATLWWRIQLDPANETRDEEFSARVEQAISQTTLWSEREPGRAEAWFYHGAAYALRAQWRGLRGETLAAARDGKRIHEALERAVALDPALDDAYFGLGLYRYYADIAPLIARMFRWLLLLPGGDREAGLQQMMRVHTRGHLLRGEADYQLFLVHLWYEHDPKTALDLLHQLRARYGTNPLFTWREAEVLEVYLHDQPASLAVYRRLLDAALGGRVKAPELTEVLARLFHELYEPDLAIEHLLTVVRQRPDAPFAALARAHLLLGVAYDRLGQREDAVDAFEAALATVPRGDRSGIADSARERLRRLPDPRTAEAHRLSLTAWRLAKQQPGTAAGLFARAFELAPENPVIRYRYGVFLAPDQPEAALEQLAGVTAAREDVPPTFLAAACLVSGQILERRGKRQQARVMYERATQVFGGGAETRDAAKDALAHLVGQVEIRPRD